MAYNTHTRFGLDQHVCITAINTEAQVHQLCRAGTAGGSFITYEVVWFSNGIRQSAWVRESELTEIPEGDCKTAMGFKS